MNGSDFVNCRFFVNESCWLAALMNQCAPVMMSLNEIGFITHFIDERSAAGTDLTYFTENKKMIEDKTTQHNRHFH